VHTWNRLKNRDPGKHYVLVSLTDKDQGTDYYIDIGYDFERQEPNGVALAGGRTTRKPGDVIEFRGHALMSCPLARKAEIDEVGPDGATGQRGADELENRIVDRSRGVDPIRGIGSNRYGRSSLYYAPDETGHDGHLLDEGE
jgi:hypothetical protein